MTHKIAICAPSHDFVRLYLRNFVSTIRKKLVSNNMPSTCPHNMANFGPLTAGICSRVWGTPANFNGFASCLRYCSDVAHRRPTKLCTMFDRLLGCYTFIFGVSCPLAEFCPVQYSLYVQVLRSYVLAALLHGTPAAGVSQLTAAWYKEWNHGTFAEGATYIRQGLGIGPHSSPLICVCVCML